MVLRSISGSCRKQLLIAMSINLCGKMCWGCLQMNGKSLLYMYVYTICLWCSWLIICLFFNVKATVLLNANIAFLAIQSVDSSSVMGHRSNAQIASYLSAVTSLGAIVLGLILVREHNTSSLNVCQIFWWLLNQLTDGFYSIQPSFVANRSASVYGLEALALMYSLPYALLMWG